MLFHQKQAPAPCACPPTARALRRCVAATLRDAGRRAPRRRGRWLHSMNHININIANYDRREVRSHPQPHVLAYVLHVAPTRLSAR